MKPVGSRTGHTRSLALVVCCVAASVLGAHGELVLQDDFSGKTPATNRLDDTGLMGAWLTTAAPGTTAIVDDSASGGMSSTNALFVDTTVSFNGVAGVFDVVGPAFDSADLSLPGNALELRFRFRVPALAAGTNDLRFGILNDGGTLHSTDNQAGTGDTDTIGFGGRVSVSATPGTGTYAFLLDGNTGGGEANMLGGAGLATFGSSGARPFIADTNAHEAVFRITRTASGYDLKLEVDGGTTFSVSTNTLPATAFHQFGIVSANAGNDVIIDDVEIDRNTLRNGTFERGQPVANDGVATAFVRNWSTNNGNTATAQPGLVDGSHTAVFMDGDVSGNRGAMTQTPEMTGTNWKFDVDFAAEDGGAAAARSFNLLLVNSGNSGQINLRLNGDSAFQIFDTAIANWQTISPTNLVNFVLDANGNNMFDTNELTSAYHLTIFGEDYGLPTANYDLLLYSIADPNTILWSTNDLAFWQNASAISNNVLGLSSVQFTTAGSAADFAVDNVSLVIIPEPSALVLSLFGLAFAACWAFRRRGA